jgi:hypothetical protein
MPKKPRGPSLRPGRSDNRTLKSKVTKASIAVRLWRLPTWVHFLALMGLLTVALSWVGVEGVVTSDEGAYGLQARMLDQGRWSIPYSFTDLDPSGSWYPYINGDIGSNGFFPYLKHPLYPALLSFGFSTAGTVGMYCVTASGAVLSAYSASLLARGAGPSAQRLAFWLCGLSPLFINGQILWAHAPATAAVGIGLALLRRAWDSASDTARIRSFLAGGAAFGVAVLLRSEALLALFAAAGAWMVVAGRPRSRGFRSVLSFTCVPVAAFLGQRWVVSMIAGEPLSVAIDRSQGVSFVAGRLEGAWRSIGAPADMPGARGAVIVACSITAVALAFRAGRLFRDSVKVHEALLLVLVATILVSASGVASGWELVPGLLPAWPFAAFGIGAMGWRSVVGFERVLLWFVILYVAMVAVTQYSDGGGTQWGGRFFALAIPALCALFGAAIMRSRGALISAGMGAAVAALVLVPALLAVVATHETRSRHGEVIREVAVLGEGIVVTDQPFFPRSAWYEPGITWLLVDDNALEVAERVAGQRDQKVFVLRGEAPHPDRATVVPSGELSASGLQLLSVTP